MSQVVVVLLASDGQSPGTLLPILRCTGQPPNRNDPASNVRRAEGEAPGLSWWCPLEYFPSFPVSGGEELNKGNFHFGQEWGASFGKSDCPVGLGFRMGLGLARPGELV